MNDAEIYASTALVGAIAGMRSLSAPALISQIKTAGTSGDLTSFFQHAAAPKTTSLLALGEFVADKLPFTPARTKLGSLGFRAISGALSGAAICRAYKRPPLLGALLGAAAAAGTTFAAYRFRAEASKALHLPDPVVALAEDAVVALAGARLMSKLNEV
jgi:uncharacterized membrane protein